MSEGTENTQNVHILKKRLLGYLNESPQSNERVLSQQDASDEPDIELLSIDGGQLKNGNESIKVLEVHVNQETKQSDLAPVEEIKIQNRKETFSIDEHEEVPNNGKQLCQEYRRLDGTSPGEDTKLVEGSENHIQVGANKQQHFVNPEMQVTNLFKSQINTIFKENEIRNTMISNTNNNASVDNQLETINNVASYLNENFEMISFYGGNESDQGVQADNEMHLTNSHKSEINTTKEANDIAIEGRENIMITDTATSASFHNQLPTNEEVTAFLKETFQMICYNANDKESQPAVTPHINKDGLEKFQRYVEHFENVVRIKRGNWMTKTGATTHLLNFAEKLEQQEEIEDVQNIVVQESEDKKDFKMPYTNDNKYDIPQAHNQNEYLRQSPDNTHYIDLKNFELQSNKEKNIPHSIVSPEEQINNMKNLLKTRKMPLDKPETENIYSSAKYASQIQIKNRFKADENGMVCIGPNGTMVSRRKLESINWSKTGSAVTRQILVEIFGRKTLAVHNLTGKPSPAFIGCNKPVKRQLPPMIVGDIIHLMGEQKGLTSKEVRNAITIKCADENKMLRLKEKKAKYYSAKYD